LAGIALDSIIFPTMAFGVLMPEIIIGQFITKVAGGGIRSFILQLFFDRSTPEAQTA